ncbi:Inheritance of peroxisomes protein 2 [Kluyveromyces marxianus]
MDIFQGVPFYGQHTSVDFTKMSSSASTPCSISSSNTWSHVRPQIATNYQQLRKLSEWGIEALQDTSPTVVGQERFDSNDVFIDDDYRKDFQFDFQEDTKWEKQVELIMKQLPYGNMDTFIDEFQYEIISSQQLTNSFGSNKYLFNAQKSIMNFTKENDTSLRNNKSKTIPTKYGQLLISGKKYFLQRSVPYIFTMLFVRKTLRKILYKKNLKRSSVISLLMIAVYLALQQEFFHVKYSKYAALMNLRQLNIVLQSMEKLLYRYHLRFKELTIYKPIAITQNHGFGYEDTKSLAVINDILPCALDQLFYRLKISASNILPIINTSQLTSYTSIYNLDLQKLYELMWTTDSLDISEKLERTQYMKKFLLCCLLSINDNIPHQDHEVVSMLDKIFPEYRAETKSDIEKFQIISKELGALRQAISAVLPILHHNKYLLFSLTSEFTGSSSEPQKRDTQINQTLSRLIELQRYLMKQTTICDDVSDHLTNELTSLQTIWTEKRMDKSRIRDSKNSKVHHSQKALRPPNQRVFSNGLNLDIVKTNKEHRENAFVLSSAPKLTSLVDVLQIEETGSDIEKDHEEIVYGDENDNSISSNKDLKFSRFTDDQLRYELNQRIQHLAIENKKSRENLRKQKSFELMNRKIENQSKGWIPPESQALFTSEESIPVLFELKQYLNNN